VIHTSFNTPGKLSLMAERKVMEKLRNRYPYALHVFSDAEVRLWHFVIVLHAERTGDKQYRRIIAALTSRIPAIEAPQEARESPETLEEEQERVEKARSDAGGTQEGVQRRPWWRRWFRG
jgi:hypothetical protein